MLLSGCCTAKSRDAVTEFRIRQPEEAKKYVYIHPVSVDLYRKLFELHVASVEGVVADLRSRFGDLQGMAAFADAVAKLNHEGIAKMNSAVDGLEKACDGGGSLCEYKRIDDRVTEGLIVLKEGSIVQNQTFSIKPHKVSK